MPTTRAQILHHILLWVGTFLVLLAATPGIADSWKALIAAVPPAISRTFIAIMNSNRKGSS